MNTQCKYVFEDNNHHKTQCTHSILNHKDFCVFHDPTVTKNAASFNSALVDLIHKFETGDYETIDLRGFKFPDFSYQGKTFSKPVDLRYAEFLGKINFDHVTFESPVDFHRATFHMLANFQGAVFQCKALFVGVIFKQKTLFIGGEFKEKVLFHGCKFFELAVFQSRRFTGPAVFHTNTFYKDAVFLYCKFTQAADFSKTLFKQRASFDNALFSGEIKLEETNISLLKGMKGVGLNFDGAVLESAYFLELPVLEKCSFRNAFLISCNFSGKTLIDCDFTGAVLKAVYTAGWKLDEKTKENTKYVFTDYKITEHIIQDGINESKYDAVKESRVPIKGNFGDEKNKDYTILNFAKEPYKWEYLLDLPEEIQTGILNYINFFRDYARVTNALDVGIATTPVGKNIKLSFLLDDEGKQDKVKLLLKQYLRNIFVPFDQLQIDFNHSQASDHDRSLFLANYQNELITSQARFIYALQDLSLRQKTIEGIGLVASEDTTYQPTMMRLLEKVIDKYGSAQPTSITVQSTATSNTQIEINIENKSEIRLSLAELYDEINAAVNQIANKPKIAEVLSEEIDAVSKDILKNAGTAGIKQRLLDITSRGIRFAKNALDYGITNGDKILSLCDKLGKMIGS